MSIFLLIGIGVVVIIIAVVLILLLQTKKPTYPPMDISNMVTELSKATVKQIRFVRNKIVVDVEDITLFDADAFQATGVKGIMIVGDTIKFYIDGDNERNEQLFEQLQQELER